MAEASVRRRRLRLAVSALALGVVLLALVGWLVPEIARREIERRLSGLFPGVVTIGSLGIGWRDASVHADAVDVWAIDAPAAPLLRVAKLSIRFDLGALRRHEVHVREAVLVDPELHVERLADGRFSVSDLASEATAAPVAPTAPSADEAPPWAFRIDAVRLVGGRVRFRDLAVEGSDALAIEIERVDLDGVSLAPGPLPEPATLQVEAKVGSAPVRLAIQASQLLPRLAFQATLGVSGFRLDGAALAGEVSGLESLTGSVDATLHHVFETDVASVLDGTVTLHDVAVGARRGRDAPPALGFERLEVALDQVDLRARAAHLGRVVIAGASVLVTPDGRTLVPALAPRLPVPPALPDDVTAPPPTPWSWTVSELAIPEARVRLQAEGAEPLDVTATLGARTLDGALAKPFPVTLEASAAGGKLTLSGDAQAEPTGFRGTLRGDGLDVARVLGATGAAAAPFAARVPGARLGVDLGLDLPADDAARPAAPDWTVRGKLSLSAVARPDPPEDAPASLTVGFASAGLSLAELSLANPLAQAERRRDGTLRVRGSLQVAGAEGVITPQPGAPGLAVRVAGLDLGLEELTLPDPLAARLAAPVTARGRIGLAGLALSDYAAERDPELVVAWQRLEASLDELRLAAPPAEPGDQPPALRLERARLGGLRVEAPWLHVTRTANGFSLPAAFRGGSGGREPADLAAVRVALANGNARFVDQTVTPYYDADVGAIRLDARALRSKGPTLEGVTLEATSGRDATLRIEGGGDANGLTFVADAAGVALPPLNPYATALGYDVRSGVAKVTSSVWIGTTGIEAKNWLALRDLAVRELVPGRFEKTTGVSLAFALDVMTSRSGVLELTLPIWWNAQGFGVRGDETLRAATRQAIVGTILLPLTRLGAWVGGKGDEPKIEPPPPIPFEPGSAGLSAAAEERMHELARFLASRPGVAIALEAKTAVTDGADAAARHALAALRLDRVDERLRQGYGVPAKQLKTRPILDVADEGAAEVRIFLDHL